MIDRRRESCLVSSDSIGPVTAKHRFPAQSCGPRPLTGIMKRISLLLPTTSSRNEAFIAAGKKLGVEMITAADYCHRLAPGWGLDPMMAVHFDRPGDALEVVLRSLKHRPDAVLAVDDPG